MKIIEDKLHFLTKQYNKVYFYFIFKRWTPLRVPCIVNPFFQTRLTNLLWPKNLDNKKVTGIYLLSYSCLTNSWQAVDCKFCWRAPCCLFQWGRGPPCTVCHCPRLYLFWYCNPTQWWDRFHGIGLLLGLQWLWDQQQLTILQYFFWVWYFC